jgi:hypothetical protein
MFVEFLVTAAVAGLQASEQTPAGGTPAPPITSPAKPADPLPQPPPPAGQAAVGVTSYPAAFFASAQPNTASDMVARLPGFVLDVGTTVRGFAGAAGNVLVDGERPASKSDSLSSILGRIPASQVARIDIIRGGAPGIDMQGKTVVANVIRRTGPSTTGLVGLSNQFVTGDGRNLGMVRLEATHRQADTSLEGSLVVGPFLDDGSGDGKEARRGPNGDILSNRYDTTSGANREVAATAAYERPVAGGRLRLNLKLLHQTYTGVQDSQDLASIAIPPELENDHQVQKQAELGLTYTHPVGAKASLETVFIQQLQSESYLSKFSDATGDDRFRERHSNGESVLHSTLTYSVTPSLTLEGGGEGAFNWLDSHTDYMENGATVVLPAAAVRVTELRGEGFAKATWVMSPKLTLEGGLKVEASHIASTGDVVVGKTLAFPKPRAVVTWSLDDSNQLRFRAEREVGQLDFSDFVASSSLGTGQVQAGNPDLIPQHDWVLEAAYERRFWKAGDIGVTYRHLFLSDVIDRAPVFSPGGVFDTPANIGGGSEDDLVLNASLPLERFGIKGGLLKGNVTWRWSRVTDPTTGETRPITALRPREGEIDFSQDLPKLKVTWGASIFFGWSQTYYRFSQVEVDNLSPIYSLFVEYKPDAKWALRLEADNLGEDFSRDLAITDGVRGRDPLLYSARRDLVIGPVVYAEVRRTF